MSRRREAETMRMDGENGGDDESLSFQHSAKTSHVMS